LPVIAVTLVVVRLYPPTFRSTGLLMIDAGRANVAGVGEIYDPTPAGSTAAEFYKTEFELLRSRSVLEAAAREVGAFERPEFRSEPDPIAAFADTVTVLPIRETRLVRVSVDSRNADFAAAAARATLHAFIDERAGSLKRLTDGGLASLRTQEAELRKRHEDASRDLRAFLATHAMLSIDDEQQSPSVQALGVLTAELARARAERARAEARCEAFANALGNHVPGRVPEVTRTRVIEELTLSLTRAEEEKDRLAKSFGLDHPQMRAVNARVGSLEARLDSERSAVLDQARRDLEVAQAQEVELASAVARAREAVSELERNATELQFLRREADLAESAYKAVAKRVEEVALSAATDATAATVLVVDEPTVSRRPVKPNRLLLLSFGTFVAMIAGLGVCRLRNGPLHEIEDADGVGLEPDLVPDLVVVDEDVDEAFALDLAESLARLDATRDGPVT
jgi:uncharacterized protein involved in exopolysaccharide biosynthesis